MPTVEELQEQLKEVTTERNKYHAALVELRLDNIEATLKDHENRIRPLQDGQVKANTIYALFISSSILSTILTRLFSNIKIP